jgi:hypothetical protein
MKGQAIKEKIKERYGSITQTGTFESVCATTECCCSSEVFSAVQMAKNIGYDAKELQSIPESSILRVGYGARRYQGR